MPSYDLSQIAQSLGVKSHGTRAVKAFRVDSRQTGPGDLFFALKGAKVDGHSYLCEVAARGAVAAVVDRSYRGPNYGLALLPIDDVLQGLQSLARDRMYRHRGKVIAVTGSVGKTTVKELLTTILGRQYRVGASKGNSNSQIGLPLTVMNELRGDEELVVLEMGMTHPGQLTQLTHIAKPDISVVTTVALVHAENFSTIEDIARAKAEIMQHSRTSAAFVHRDISNYDELCSVGACVKHSFSLTHPQADFRFESGDGGDLYIISKEVKYPLPPIPLQARHHLHNVLIAASVALHLGMRWEEIGIALQSISLPERRMQLVEKNGVLFVNDSYNACDVSMKAALKHLPIPKAGARRLAVLGNMPELGKFSEACHRDVGQVALSCVDVMFCLGEECQPIYDVWSAAKRPVQLFTDRSKLIDAMRQFVRPGDVVLLKGANSKRLWELLDEI